MTPQAESIDRYAPTCRPNNLRLVMRQTWTDLLFLHWPVVPETLQRMLPPGLTIDTWEGRAYVGLVPFRMRGVRPVWSPPVPGLSVFGEVNVRTYVYNDRGEPGVWFFSLDAANPVAVTIARRVWGLPYYQAQIDFSRESEGRIGYASRRTPLPGVPRTGDAACTVRCTPCGDAAPATPDTLPYFLAERYLLYAFRNGSVWRGQVHHTPYPLQSARLETLKETLTAVAGAAIPRDEQPIVHYAARVDVEIFPLVPARVR